MANLSSVGNPTYCHPTLFPPMRDVASIRFISFIHIFSGAVAVAGNLLVAISICLHSRLHTFTNYFILSLSIADGVVGLVGQPLMAYLLWTRGETPCVFQKVQYFAGSASCGASGLLLSLVSIERYFHICRPFLYERFVDGRKVVLAIITFSVSSMALTSISFSNINRLAYSSILLGFYVLSLVCIIPCYHFIYRTATIHVRQVDRECSNASIIQAKKTRRSTMTIFVVVLVFLGCWAPFFILNFIWNLDVDRTYNPRLLHTIFYYALTLGYFNSCLNPFLYTFNNTALRSGILQTIVKIFGKRVSKLCCIGDQSKVVPEITITP